MEDQVSSSASSSSSSSSSAAAAPAFATAVCAARVSQLVHGAGRAAAGEDGAGPKLPELGGPGGGGAPHAVLPEDRGDHLADQRPLDRVGL